MTNIRAHFNRDPWEKHKVQLTLNEAEVGGTKRPPMYNF